MKPFRQRIIVYYNGEQLSLSRLSKVTGITYETLLNRHNNGDRGEQLVRPVRGTVKSPPNQSERDDLNQVAEVKLSAKERAEQARRDRLKRMADARAKVKAEHAREFSRPLIDGRLLSKRDREAIRERVMNAGQRNWSLTGAKF